LFSVTISEVGEKRQRHSVDIVAEEMADQVMVARGPEAAGTRKRRKPLEFQNTGPPEIMAEEITYMGKIGGGCYGNVYKGKCRGQEVAVKKLFKQELSEATIKEFRKEVEICSQLHHPNVVLFMGACTKAGHLAIVTELMPKGSLESLLHDPKNNISLRQRLLMSKQVALGMNWLHRSNPPIIHRDLKPSNILVDGYLNCKVCDFGLSAIKETDYLQDKDSIPGTPLWMAPEVLLGKPLDEKSDVYSYAIVLWEIVTKEEPFPEFQSYREFKRAICRSHTRPPIPADTIPSLAHLMQVCWHREPTQRPSFAQIIPMLDVVIIDTTIADAAGATFWKNNFIGKENVEWGEFLPKLATALGATVRDAEELQWRALKAVMAVQEVDESLRDPPYVVRMRRFGQVLGWFGPFDGSLVTRVEETLRSPWFFGDAEREEVEDLLRKQEPGTFLVRASTTVSTAFTITKVSRDRRVNHQRIDYRPGAGYTIKLMTSAGKKLIQENVSLSKFITDLSPHLFLRQPAPRWPYEALFSEQPTNIEGYLVQEDGVDDEDYMADGPGSLAELGSSGATMLH